MLKKVTSIQDIHRNDVIFDGPDTENAKEYKIENICEGSAFAIHEDEMKVMNSYDLLTGSWWKKE